MVNEGGSRRSRERGEKSNASVAAEDEGEEFLGAEVAVGEGVAELAGDKEVLGEGAEAAVGELVLDLVAEEAAVDEDAGGVGAGFGMKVVAMPPGGEGAAELDVAEVIVPDELGDLGLPRDAERGVGEGTEAEGDAGAGAGGDGLEAQSGVWRYGARWGWGEGGLFDAGSPPGRHEARQVLGVGEEGEDEFDGIGEPLLGVEGVGHLLEMIAGCGAKRTQTMASRRFSPMPPIRTDLNSRVRTAKVRPLYGEALRFWLGEISWA
jgi:hypothetical protein